jgi:two-component system, cell cycle response regulator
MALKEGNSSPSDLKEKNMAVLIAEDDHVSRVILEKAVAQWGFKVVSVKNGNEALQKLEEPDSPKLALLDWMMPGLDGVEVCRKVKAIEADLPPYLILVTARDQKSDIVTGLNAGANDYVTKPFNNRELRARLEVGKRMVELQSKLYEAMERLKELALTDTLTGMPNRRAILDILEKEMARSKRTNRALLISLIDVDHFKEVNDQWGHLAGDLVLKECVRRFRSNLRRYDSVGRLGGDEFLVVIPETEVDDTPEILQRLGRIISETPISIGETALSVTISQGVAKWIDKVSLDDFLKKADDALYLAKKRGRNQTVFSNDP